MSDAAVVHRLRPVEEVLAENVAVELVVTPKIVHRVIAAVYLGRRGAFRQPLQVGEVFQLCRRQIRVVLPCRVADVVVVEEVNIPKLAVRVVVDERAEAGVGFEVGVLLLREVVRLVDKQPVAGDTFCRLGV